MNIKKSNGYGKLLVFFLVAVILIFAFGLVADGWQAPIDDNSGNVDGNNESDEADDDKQTSNNDKKEDDNSLTTKPVPLNKLTGLPIAEGSTEKRHVAFIMDTASPLYGVSGADVIVEFPVENGKTRLAVIKSDISELGKIGSIAHTKKYISNVAAFFDSALVYSRLEGNRDYDSLDVSTSALDLSAKKGYHYTEYSEYAYSNGGLITAGLAASNIDTLTHSPTLPFVFSESDTIHGSVTAKAITLPFSDGLETELIFRETDKMYTFLKGGSVKQDLLSCESISVKNVFILFADAVTYEDKFGCEMILDTLGSGSGYYVSNGVSVDILWSVGEDGNLSFSTVDGSPLTVNKGSSYIGYVKASMTDEVTLN